jgi:hypothetical protein
MKYCCETFEEYHGNFLFLKGDIMEPGEIMDENTIECVRSNSGGVILGSYVPMNFCPFCGTELLQLMYKAEVAFTNHTS